MPRTVIPLPAWIPQACALMVKYDLSLRQAAAELGHDITIEEAAALKDRKLFKEALESARLAHYAELGSDPKLNRDAVVGQMYEMARRLASDREDYKSADVLLKICKAMGWIAGEGGKPLSIVDLGARLLTQADLDRLTAEIEKAEEQGQSSFNLASAIVRSKLEKEQANQRTEKPAKVN